jgi:tRNA threonylcarbamoyladenosine biosynthesis protein TsaB
LRLGCAPGPVQRRALKGSFNYRKCSRDTLEYRPDAELVILALDTTSEFGSLALVDRDRVIDEVLLHAPEGFGHILYPRLEQLLARNGVRVNAMECFAAASGPGSFTGVRIGLAAIKGLAEAAGRPAVAVSNLQALAWFGTRPLRATLLDARRGEVYGAVYDDRLELVRPEVVMKFPDWLSTLPTGDLEFVTADAPHTNIPVVTAPRALAGAIGRIAWKRFLAGQASDPAALDANYIRRSDAELLWKG